MVYNKWATVYAYAVCLPIKYCSCDRDLFVPVNTIHNNLKQNKQIRKINITVVQYRAELDLSL